MKINTRSITLAATLTALCAVTGFIPFVFFLPVMVAATTLSIGMVAFVGLAFGCVSLAYSYLMPSSIVSFAFIDAPYIAIIPRILAALGAFAVYKLIEKLAKPKSKVGRVASCSIAAVTGSLFNTVLVVGMLVLILPSLEFGDYTTMTYVPVMLINGAIELACMAVLTPPVSLTLDKVVLRGKRRGETDAVKAAQADYSCELSGEQEQPVQHSDNDGAERATDNKRP
ncbi:MAG: hypothetical protein J1F39_03075 [Clostridiales bacterium]|nr:hypothetical protein [Clostridiales bacterium]